MCDLESRPSAYAPLSCAISASVRIINKKGDNGSPCRSPRVGLIHPFASPFSNTWYETVEIQHQIHEIHRSSKPSFRIKASRKLHSTLSYVLLMSVFMAINLALHIGLVRRAWKASCAIRILSVISRLATKAD